MNSSQFMDKQIMDLSRSQSNNNNDSTMFDLLNPPQEEKMHSSSIDNHVGGAKKEDILPSYDFQPIRPVSDSGGSNSVNLQGSNVGGTRVWSSADSKANSSARNHSYLDPDESTNFTQRNDRNNAYDATILSDIDRTMKKHADILLHSLEGVSARLCQMETRTRNLESLVDDLKVSVENDHGSTDGKLRQLENILREVQTGVQVLRDKQDIAAAHLHLMKPQASNGDQQPEIQNTAQPESVQHIAPAPQQSHQSYPPQVGLPQPPQKVQSHQSFPPQVVPSQPPQQAQSHQSFPPQVVPPQPLQQVPAANSPNVHPPATQQNQASVQLSSQVPPSQILSSSQHEHYFPPPGHLPESTHQPYQVPLTQQLQSPSPGQPQHYQSAQFPQYPQSSQPPQQHPPVSPVGPVNPSKPHLEPQVSHPPEETPYMAPQSYPPNFRQSSVTQPASGGPTSQQYYGSPVQMYEPPVSRSSTGFSPGYGPSSGTNFSDSYLYGGPHYSSSSMKQPQLPSSPSAPSGGSSSYPRLPTAQILPHALPTASSAGGGPDSSNTGNRVPIDDVVDKVATMGFSREQVRATVRKLTENGQSVDLNVVLDKLMNDGEIQPQKGWFGR